MKKENNPINSEEQNNFIIQVIEESLKNNPNQTIITRFPPEPNGYLHIGHAKSICLNFGIAEKYKSLGARCHLRFDDTNPSKEDIEYTDSIQTDVKWLGFDWGDNLFYASDYYEALYNFAVDLIKVGKAYVCDLTVDEIRDSRGTLTEPGKESPYRNRTVEENLALFEKMKNGEVAEGECVLRAKIDMSSPNINLRDPVIYRIIKTSHHRTGDKWCVYPMYDYAHPISDALENITHSICTLEFEDHRPLYDWVLDQLPSLPHPRQIEFARLNLTYTVMSKRKLLQLVEENHVLGWDDPRMPTLAGMRRRGIPAKAIRNFCDQIGVTKSNSTVEYAQLQYCIREELNKTALRKMAVLQPLKIIIDNYPDDLVEELDAENNPENPESGTRKIPFSKELYIERDDFALNPPPKFFRLSPGKEIRLKHAYYITCVSVVTDKATGEPTEIHCTYDPESRGGWTKDGRKVMGTSHWVSIKHAIKAEVRLFDQLFTVPNPGENGVSFLEELNPNSVQITSSAFLEPSLAEAHAGDKFQFLRLGYFAVDLDSSKDHLVFNRIVNLKDSWKPKSIV